MIRGEKKTIFSRFSRRSPLLTYSLRDFVITVRSTLTPPSVPFNDAPSNPFSFAENFADELFKFDDEEKGIILSTAEGNEVDALINARGSSDSFRTQALRSISVSNFGSSDHENNSESLSRGSSTTISFCV